MMYSRLVLYLFTFACSAEYTFSSPFAVQQKVA